MVKDKAYWQVYNQKRKAYLTLKKRESRERIKSTLSTTSPEDSRVVDLNHKPTEVLKVGQVVDTLSVVDEKVNQVVDQKAKEVVDLTKVVEPKPKQVVDQEVVDPTLTSLIQAWKTQTNYACPPTCLQAYCNNCWYFIKDQLVDYKGGHM